MMTQRTIKDFGFYGEKGNIETEEQLIKEITRISMMIASSYRGFYDATHNKILFIDDFIKILLEFIKNDLVDGYYLHNLIECAKYIFQLNSYEEIFIKCIDRFNYFLEEDGAILIYTISDTINLFVDIDGLLVMPEKWFSPTIYKKLTEFLKTFNCKRTKYKKQTAFKNEGEFTNKQILEIGKHL